ncbi:aminotransferase class III-fold pyridoxal phosphate-dependent enzyme, partial [Micromonospora fluostatini]
MTGRTAQATHPRTTHDDALARARAVTASDTWDLDRRFPIVLDRGSEAYVWDVQGRRYLDLTSCSGAAPLGAGHPGVVEAATRAMV